MAELTTIRVLEAIVRDDRGIGANVWRMADMLAVDEWELRVKLGRMGRKGLIDGCTRVRCNCRCDVGLTAKGRARLEEASGG